MKFVPLNVMISYGFVEMIAQHDKNIQVVTFNKKFFMDGFAGKLLSLKTKFINILKTLKAAAVRY